MLALRLPRAETYRVQNHQVTVLRDELDRFIDKQDRDA